MVQTMIETKMENFLDSEDMLEISLNLNKVMETMFIRQNFDNFYTFPLQEQGA